MDLIQPTTMTDVKFLIFMVQYTGTCVEKVPCFEYSKNVTISTTGMRIFGVMR